MGRDGHPLVNFTRYKRGPKINPCPAMDYPEYTRSMHYSDYIRDYARYYGGRLIISLSKGLFHLGAKIHGLSAQIEIRHYRKPL